MQGGSVKLQIEQVVQKSVQRNDNTADQHNNSHRHPENALPFAGRDDVQYGANRAEGHRHPNQPARRRSNAHFGRKSSWIPATHCEVPPRHSCSQRKLEEDHNCGKEDENVS